MKVARKSLHRSANAKRAKHRANQRAAKERKRLERTFSEEPMPDMSHCPSIHGGKLTGFRVTIQCLDDGERVSFITARGPYGLTISPTLASRKVACVLANYEPAMAASSRRAARDN
jgi:hypothetical protein